MGLMSGEVELAWDDRYVIIGDGPFIVIFPFVEVYEIADHPKITTSIGIIPHVKIFHPFGICLRQTRMPLMLSIPFGWKVNV
jgi:hypothetical protein